MICGGFICCLKQQHCDCCRSAMTLLPDAIAQVIRIGASISRLQNFLSLEELPMEKTTQNITDGMSKIWHSLYIIYTCMSYIPVCHIYLYVIYTCTSYIPVRHIYLYVIYTCTSYIPARHTYLRVIHTCASYIPARHTYLRVIHTCASYIHVYHIYVKINVGQINAKKSIKK